MASSWASTGGSGFRASTALAFLAALAISLSQSHAETAAVAQLGPAEGPSGYSVGEVIVDEQLRPNSFSLEGEARERQERHRLTRESREKHRFELLMSAILEAATVGDEARAIALAGDQARLLDLLVGQRIERRREGRDSPPPLLFLEARLAATSGNSLRALRILERYLAAADPSDTHHAAATLMHPELLAVAAIQRETVIGKLAQGIADEMIDIPGGTFVMGHGEPPEVCSPRSHCPGGSVTGELASNEPARRVTIAPFRLAKYPVTFELYHLYCESEPRVICPWIDMDWLTERAVPAVWVHWDDAQTFIDWLNQNWGHSFRVPTEAEWEYAARAGTTTNYWWGDDMRPGQANCNSDCTTPADPYSTLSPVGAFPPNPFGLYDMLGNAAEWTQDCWNVNLLGAPTDGSAWLSGDCSMRVRRGGTFMSPADHLRVNARNFWITSPGSHPPHIGIRLAKDP
jgi:formylglycine-generating enzyme required for sulfatase activity